jgi:hypothetical protein
MTPERLTDAAQALYSELLDLLRALARAGRDLPAGTFVSKSIQGRRYWYLQATGAGVRTQRYLGAESEQLIARMQEVERRRTELEPDRARAREVHDMLVAAGAYRDSAVGTRVVELLAASGLFRAGAVLVGTRAFGVIANSLGVRASALARTQDIDVAVDRETAVAFRAEPGGAVSDWLTGSEPPFLPIPGFDPRQASTSFKLRGREHRIDFLIPLHGPDRERPVELPALGLAAWPLRLLDYLIENPGEGALLGSQPILVPVPDPARFALHKLWVARRRPTSETLRARKDREQASLLLAALLEDRPDLVERAAAALRRHRHALAPVRAELERLPLEGARDLVGMLR